MEIRPFKIDIGCDELTLLRMKLENTRVPTNLESAQWNEPNGVSVTFMSSMLDFWREEYDWRSEEARLNKMPQYKTTIALTGFDTLNIHFVHSVSSMPDAIPLLLLHGWPGSFAEFEKIMPMLNQASFHVVAPSLPGYGFSSYPKQAGFKQQHHAEVVHRLMLRLGYPEYALQGGDWGAYVARCVALLHPNNVKAIHLNHFTMPEPQFDQRPTYSDFEKRQLQNRKHFQNKESDYYRIQKSKTLTLSFAMHDSPIGLLAWIVDKINTWSDTDAYTWSRTELITWTLLHYFPGPATGLVMYREDAGLEMTTGFGPGKRIEVATGMSAFAKELEMVPRSWAELWANIVFWREHPDGGHFAAYERPADFAADLIFFYRSLWDPSPTVQ